MRTIRNNPAAGFTLIEILLVVVLLAVVLGLAVPNFKASLQRVTLQQAVRQLSYVMRYAQDRAIKNDKQQRLMIDSSQREYILKEEAVDAKDSSADKKFGQVPGKWGRVFRIPEGISLESAPAEVNFFSDGKIDRVRICLCRSDDCLTVSTKEQTGFVDIYEGRMEQ